MTEEQWLNASDLNENVQCLRSSGRVNDRTLRLFAVACCRHIWDQLTDERSRQAVETDECHADGRANRQKMARARRAAQQAFEAGSRPLERQAAWAAWAAVRQGRTRNFPVSEASDGEMWVVATAEAAARSCRLTETEERRYQFALILDIFRPLPPPLTWHDSLVENLAQAAYENSILPSGELDRARLAVLADAIEESGCTDTELLEHLRGPGPHVRGCWALDLLTARN
jgi:hypothetical protein